MGMVIFLCQLKNQPPIPRERYVFWCIQNTQKHGLTLTWTREPSEIAKSEFDHDFAYSAATQATPKRAKKRRGARRFALSVAPSTPTSL